MSKIDFKYDVAFSFAHQDEELAYTLFNLLKARLSCFIYSEEQKKLAGGDGEILFNTVFSEESRIVVILFRTEYGNTKWTRIEETAIRNRGYDEGYDFALLIPTDKLAILPKWLPKTKLWIGLERWGIEHAAAVIEARVQEYGGVVKNESIADIAAISEEKIKNKIERENLLNSYNAIEIALQELANLKTLFELEVDEIKAKAIDWKINIRKNNHNGLDIFCYGYFLTFHFYQQWNNTLTDAYLHIAFYKGYFSERGEGTDPFNRPKNIDLSNLQFDIDEFNQNGWSIRDTRLNFTTSLKLVQKWLGKLIASASEERMKGNY